MKMKMFFMAAATVLSCVLSTQTTFNVSLELQGGECSDQLTLICRHSDNGNDPLWIHNDTTVEGGDVLATAFPGANYTVQALTEHIASVFTIRALDGHVIQCAYTILGNLIKSNAVTFSFIPPDFQPKLKRTDVVQSFSERFCTLTYELEGYTEGIAKYRRCADQFSVNFTVTPNANMSSISTDAVAQCNITNLERCKVYDILARFYQGDQVLDMVYDVDSVMTSPGQFTITSVSIGVDRNLINVTYMENEPDCPGYPTERYTVDVDGVQVADLTADEFQSLAINHTTGSVTLSLPLSQPLPENAVTLNMTKYNTVPTNRSDDMGKMATEMVPWGTSAVFDLSQESSAATNDKGEVSVGVVVGVVISVISVTNSVVITIAVALVIARKRKANKCGTCDLKATDTNKQPMTNEVDSEAASEEEGTNEHPMPMTDEVGSEVASEEENDPPNEVQPQGQHGCGPTPAAAFQGPQPEKGTKEQGDRKTERKKHPVRMTNNVESDAVGEEKAPVSVAEERSDPQTKEYVVSGKEVKQSPPPAAEAKDDNLGEPEEESHPNTESTKQPKVALTRGNTAGGEAPQKTICAFGDDASTGLDYISGDKVIAV